MPIVEEAERIVLCGTESKAFLTSKKTQATCLCLDRSLNQERVTERSASWVGTKAELTVGEEFVRIKETGDSFVNNSFENFRY